MNMNVSYALTERMSLGFSYISSQSYQVTLYGCLDIKGKIPHLVVGVWGTLGVISACGGAYFFDKCGRRKRFFISITGLTIWEYSTRHLLGQV
jgi:hypothetical protein